MLDAGTSTPCITQFKMAPSYSTDSTSSMPSTPTNAAACQGHCCHHRPVEPIPAPACQCQPEGKSARRFGRGESRALTIKSPFMFSCLVGFSAMVLWKNLFLLTSTVGFTALTLLALGKQGIIQVDWKKIEDLFDLPEISQYSLTLKVPSKAGFCTGLFFAWKFFA
ncbi:Aste57867_14415 [Aphanomyces stellatus]|uniref:Aste57867_14415 protein n=1 Tax=Aphanomyces stellatus TaxID=120398 RepID=A0A485L324_9STRA|nr:hypothetical protein As57867_014361 [Aphanomyces stellatus]VFT91237.1 Aste57867_14415 [Aphanomyces stellatus]